MELSTRLKKIRYIGNNIRLISYVKPKTKSSNIAKFSSIGENSDVI